MKKSTLEIVGDQVAMPIMTRMAQIVLEDAKANIHSITGNLANSGRVEKEGKGCIVIFGDENVDYAVYVHEKMTPGNRSAKFLQRAVLKNI